MQRNIFILALSALLIGVVAPPGQAQTPCVNGRAGSHPCNKVTLLSQLTPLQLLAEAHQGVYINDIWGWTDPETGKEYALVGMTNGTSFVDVSDPLNPVVVGMLLEHNAPGQRQEGSPDKAGVKHDGAKSVWRDIKVYKDHAFVVSEDPGHGMQVFDLRQLRNATNMPVEYRETANYSGIGSAHNIIINEATGYAYAVGADDEQGDCRAGGLHMINIQDPANPVFAGCFDDDGYTHDAQVVIYQGTDADYVGKEIAFAANEDAITIVDVTDKASPVLISTVAYNVVAYAHQGWLTEDHQYFISDDELDEHHFGTNTRSFIWDMRDLDNPRLLDVHEATTPSIDHNMYIKEGLVYQSNYTAGLRILSIKDIAAGKLEELAYFDTYPRSNEVIYEGSWSNYPYFKSGNIVVSDVTRGLYILKHKLDEPDDAKACLAGTAALEVAETRLNVAYQWQVNEGTGFIDLADNETYSGVTTTRLQIAAVDEAIINNKYRVISKNISNAALAYQSEEASIVQQTETVALFEHALESSGGGVTFTNLSEGATSYRWDFGDGSTPVTEASPEHEFQGQPPFTVVLEATNECGTTSYSAVLSRVTGLEEELAQGITLFPNPSSGTITLKTEDNVPFISAIGLFSLSGKQLMEYLPLSSMHEKKEYPLHLQAYPKGIYLLRIITEKNVISRKLVLE